MEINELSTLNTISGGDLLVIYSVNNSDARKISITSLMNYMQSNLIVGMPQYTTQYSAPSATAFSVSITDNGSNIHLILTPTAGFADGTIVLPLLANCTDKQMIMVNCTQAITTLAITPNGSTVTGAPTTLAANEYFTLKFDALTSTWYRVG